VSGKPDDEAAFLFELGRRVRQARSAAGLTRRQLAERSGLSERYLAQLEAGEGNISVLLMRRVARVLRTDLAQLVAEPGEILARHTRVALIGLRGAGKSTLGPVLARQLDVPFIELDQEIARDLDLSLKGVFDQFGQDVYRQSEREMLLRITARHERCVLAIGGSVVLEPTTYRLLKERCLTVWLKATPEDHMARVVAQGDTRPMNGREHAMAELRAILRQREALYAQADHVVDTSALDIDGCVARLLRLTQAAFRGDAVELAQDDREPADDAPAPGA
jgi:XRE family aerobic/anaerobic benzoate catabolism transcriptional regulator